MAAVWKRIVTAVAELRLQSQPIRLSSDLGLAHMLERSVDRESIPFHPRLRRKVRHTSERSNEFRPAIRVARIIESVDTDKDIARTARLREAERQAEENCVPRGYIGNRDALAEAMLWNFDIGGQRRAAECPKIERKKNVALSKPLGNRSSGIQLDPVPLIIVDSERDHRISLLTSDSGAHHRIEAAGQEDHCALHIVMPIFGAAQNHSA